MFCYGVSNTLKALEIGAVDTLLIWEKFQVSEISYFIISFQYLFIKQLLIEILK